MKERPILFSGAMVRALLDGSKTQTRRVMKKQPYISQTNPPQFSDIEVGDLFICPDYAPTSSVRGSVIAECEGIGTYHCMGQRSFAEKHSPYGIPGDSLWVRETWSTDFAKHYPFDRAWYAADGDRKHEIEVRDGVKGIYSPESVEHVPFRWRPSIHMPRWVSRITLEVTGVRVERLQDISEADARAEGAVHGPLLPMGFNWPGCDPDDAVMRSRFAVLWHSINAARGFGWDANPWVWVIQFERTRP